MNRPLPPTQKTGTRVVAFFRYQHGQVGATTFFVDDASRQRKGKKEIFSSWSSRSLIRNFIKWNGKNCREKKLWISWRLFLCSDFAHTSHSFWFLLLSPSFTISGRMEEEKEKEFLEFRQENVSKSKKEMSPKIIVLVCVGFFSIERNVSPFLWAPMPRTETHTRSLKMKSSDKLRWTDGLRKITEAILSFLHHPIDRLASARGMCSETFDERGTDTAISKFFSM